MNCPCKRTTVPIFCKVHKLTKTPHWVILCQTRADYRLAWDEGRGPGQMRKERPGRRVEAPVEVIDARMAVCEQCDQFNPQSQRCAQLDFGCASVYRRVVKAEGGVCPLGSWEV